MTISDRFACTLLLAAIAWPTSAKDFYWNCTTAAGTQYADATQCDKGDTGIQVMKGRPSVQEKPTTRSSAPAPATTAQTLPTACQAVPAYCDRPDFGVVDASERAQTITQFMRRKECEFFWKFPPRCVTPNQHP